MNICNKRRAYPVELFCHCDVDSGSEAVAGVGDGWLSVTVGSEAAAADETPAATEGERFAVGVPSVVAVRTPLWDN